MNVLCTGTQEALAWSQTLTDEAREHCTHCSACAAFSMQMEALAAGMRDLSGGDVPPGFADRMMAQIEDLEAATGPTWLDLALGRWAPLLEWAAFRWSLVGAGVFIALANLARFVFPVLLPSTT